MKSQPMQDTVFFPQVDQTAQAILDLRGKPSPPTHITISFKAGAGDVTKNKLKATGGNIPPQGEEDIGRVPDYLENTQGLRIWLIRRACHAFLPDEAG